MEHEGICSTKLPDWQVIQKTGRIFNPKDNSKEMVEEIMEAIRTADQLGDNKGRGERLSSEEAPEGLKGTEKSLLKVQQEEEEEKVQVK